MVNGTWGPERGGMEQGDGSRVPQFNEDVYKRQALFWLLEVQPLAITAAQRLTKTRKIIPYSDLLITKAAPCVYLSW